MDKMTFGTVQRMAAEAGLAMSRDSRSRDIRLRYRDQPGGSRWVVATLAEALEVIAREADRGQRGRSDAA